MGRDKHSFVNVGWLNGMQRKYYLNECPDQVDQMINDIKRHNKIVLGKS